MFRRILGIVTAVALISVLVGCAGGQKTPQEYYDMGIRYLSEGDYEEAVLVFSALLEIEPNHVQALTGRGQALQHLGGAENLDFAQTDYRAALEIDDSDEQIWLALADLLLETGAESDAKDLLAQAYEKFGASDDLSGRIARLKESGALDGEDLSRFGLVADNTKDFQPSQLTEAETKEIIDLLRLSYPGYDCTDPEAEKRAIDFLLEPYHNVFSLYFPTDEIHTPFVDSGNDDEPVLPDPLGQIPINMFSIYDIAPGMRVDWLLQNVYNVEPSHPASAVRIETTDFDDKFYYYYNEEYYIQQPYGIGSDPDFTEYTLHDIMGSEDFLYLRFHSEWEDWIDPSEVEEYDNWALLKKNTAGGRTVWSLCWKGDQPIEDISRFLAWGGY